MDIRLRLLTAEIAILTAIASLFVTDTEEWTKVYERRLFCEMQMNLWRGGNEQKAVEEIPTGANPISARSETASEAPLVLVSEVVTSEQTASEEAPTAQRTRQEETVEEVPQSSPAEAETERPTETAAVYTPTAEATPVYTVDGERLDPGVADYLYRRLCESNIGWFYPFALLIAYQESSFNPLAENVNGRDFGLFQFRLEFHSGLDWQNPYAQVDLFVQMMANRANAGKDVYSMISAHNMSDWGGYNQVYVDQVMGHNLQEIR